MTILTVLSEATPSLKILAGMTREEWLRTREDGLGSSDAPALAGISPWASPLSVWQDKTGRGEPTEDNQFMEAGRYLEPVIAQWFGDKTGLVVHRIGSADGECVAIINSDRPWERCTPDAFVMDPEHGLCIVEFKTAAGWKASDWSDGPPLSYQLQVQHQLMVCDLHSAYIAVLIGGNDFRYFFVERNDRLIDTLRVMEEKFWTKHVLTDEPPGVSLGMDFPIVQGLHGADLSDDAVALPGSFIGYDERLREIKDQIKELEEEQGLLKARFAEAIGPHYAGVLPNGVTYTNKFVHRKESVRTVKACQYRVLRRKSSGMEQA